MHNPKVKIIQPEGIKYMIQEYHYSKQYAQDYIDMLIDKSDYYIAAKNAGKLVAPLMTVEQLKNQLDNIKKFKIIEIDDKETSEKEGDYWSSYQEFLVNLA